MLQVKLHSQSRMAGVANTTDELSGGHRTEPKLVNLGGSGCTERKRCMECQGDCDSDADCASGLRCLQRDSSAEHVPGCKSGGTGDIGTTDYCYDPVKVPVLSNLGSSGCKLSKQCTECQGDCDQDADCAYGLECFQRDSSVELVPGCKSGGSGDNPTTDYCYDPSKVHRLANRGSSGCTAGYRCTECQGDCDVDSDCFPGLKCFQRDTKAAKVPGCTSGGSGDISTHDYCYDPSKTPQLSNLGSSGCKNSDKCTACQGDCDKDTDCFPGLKCFQRNTRSERVPGCKSGGSGDEPTTDYCYDPSATPELSQLGSICPSKPGKCLECQGDCSSDRDCAPGLLCFKRDTSAELVPGCIAGGPGDVNVVDYCYDPSKTTTTTTSSTTTTTTTTTPEVPNYKKLDYDCFGSDLANIEDVTVSECAAQCNCVNDCQGFSHFYPHALRCVLKGTSLCSKPVNGTGWHFYLKVGKPACSP